MRTTTVRELIDELEKHEENIFVFISYEGIASFVEEIKIDDSGNLILCPEFNTEAAE